MGQTLSEPVTEKTTSSGGNASVLYAISEMQGWRISMEDSHATILDIKDAKDNIVGNFFGVYDGHGGEYGISTFAAHSAVLLTLLISASFFSTSNRLLYCTILRPQSPYKVDRPRKVQAGRVHRSHAEGLFGRG